MESKPLLVLWGEAALCVRMFLLTATPPDPIPDRCDESLYQRRALLNSDVSAIVLIS